MYVVFADHLATLFPEAGLLLDLCLLFCYDLDLLHHLIEEVEVLRLCFSSFVEFLGADFVYRVFLGTILDCIVVGGGMHTW